jgi:pyrroloquinoline quinone biosynthesis protein D
MTPASLEIPMNMQYRVSTLFRLQWEEAQQSWVLLFPEGMVKLNGSAGEIMKRLDGTRSTSALIEELEREFGAPDVAPDVLAFLDYAAQKKWIV